jgi:hypothetical protein
MAVTADNLRTASTWRTPLVIIICGCSIALLSFGPRSSLGFFIQPMGREFAGAATSSVWRWRCRICCGALASRSRVRSPIVSAFCV